LSEVWLLNFLRSCTLHSWAIEFDKNPAWCRGTVFNATLFITTVDPDWIKYKCPIQIINKLNKQSGWWEWMGYLRWYTINIKESHIIPCSMWLLMDHGLRCLLAMF
jgi:hypothetical protein